MAEFLLTGIELLGSVERAKKELATRMRGKLSARLTLVMTSTQTRISYNALTNTVKYGH